MSDARGDVVTAEFLLKVATLPIEITEDPAGDLGNDPPKEILGGVYRP